VKKGKRTREGHDFLFPSAGRKKKRKPYFLSGRRRKKEREKNAISAKEGGETIHLKEKKRGRGFPMLEKSGREEGKRYFGIFQSEGREQLISKRTKKGERITFSSKTA